VSVAQSVPPPRSADDVLPSKTLPPARPDWVIRRSRIEDHIAAVPLTVVTGPAGAGKTTAVASWAAHAEGPVAWVTLDRYDSQWDVFWTAVVAALECAGVEFRRALPAPGQTDNHAFLLRLAAELAAQERPVTLVLDDLQRIDGHELDEGLQYLIRNTRPGLRVVICSRADPALSLHHYRLAGELTEIRAAELGFSAPEARLLMAQHGVTLPDGPLEQLTALNEGWAAGLRMAALSLQDEPDPERFVRQFAAEDGAIAGYLMEEVLNKQPPRYRDLLLKTSILERVNAGLAVEMTGDERAGDVLGALAHAHAFVEPAGNGWYRLHSLFGEVLRLKLRFNHPHEVPDLHRRAARWYQAHQHPLQAVRQAAAAGDWLFAARLVVDDLAVSALFEGTERDPLTECFRAMPYPGPGPEPQPALVAAAIALADGQEDSARTALAAAGNSVSAVPAGQQTAVRIALATLRLELARRTGDIAAAADSAGQAEQHLRTLPEETQARLAVRMLAERGLLLLWAGQPDEAAASLSAAHPDSAEHGPDCADYHGHLALAEAFRGRPRAAAQILETTCAPRDGERLSSAAEVALAVIHLERHGLQETRNPFKRADAALGVRPDRLAAALACFAAARWRLAGGQAGGASELAARARHGWSPPGWLDRRLTLLESRASAAAGDIASAVAAAERCDPGGSLDAAAALAHARLEAGDPLAAGIALGSGQAITDEIPAARCLEWRLTEARFAFSTGDDARGRRLLLKAVKVGEREELRLSIDLENAWMRPLLRGDPQLAEACRYLPAVSPADSGPPAGGRIPAQRDGSDPVIVEELSVREREVLRLLAGMLTTAEVAGELYISVNTVKSHLKSIYRKLAARHRGEAVRRAQQLRMI
jgi:LuxR family transcriptional regulator, maltose regulon positive regulatory protein